MSPRTPTPRDLVLLLACALAGFCWWHLYSEQQKAVQELERVQLGNVTEAARMDLLLKAGPREQPSNVLPPAQSPVETRRRRVAELVERLKAARLARTGTPIPPSPNKSYGSIFAELMDDPHYAKLAMLSSQQNPSGDDLIRFRWAGVPPEKQGQLLELLRELHLTSNDVSLGAAKAGVSEQESWLLQMLNRREGNAEIETLLGKETYQRYEKARSGTGAMELIRALDARLSYSNAPLREDQTGKLFGALLTTKFGFQLTPEQAIQLIEAGGPVLDPAQRESFEEIVAEFNLGKWSSGPTPVAPVKQPGGP